MYALTPELIKVDRDERLRRSERARLARRARQARMCARVALRDRPPVA